MNIHALPRPACDLREVTRSLCTPAENPLPAGPRPEPSDQLLKARASEPLYRGLRLTRNLALGAGACLVTGTAGKVCGALVGATGLGVMVGVMAGLATGLPLLLVGATKNSKLATGAGLALIVAGALGGLVTGAYAGWTLAGEGLSLASGLLGASAVLMKTKSSSLARQEEALQKEIKGWKEREAAFARGEKPAEPEPLQAPSAIEQLGDVLLVGGIRLPKRVRP